MFLLFSKLFVVILYSCSSLFRTRAFLSRNKCQQHTSKVAPPFPGFYIVPNRKLLSFPVCPCSGKDLKCIRVSHDIVYMIAFLHIIFSPYIGLTKWKLWTSKVYLVCAVKACGSSVSIKTEERRKKLMSRVTVLPLASTSMQECRDRLSRLSQLVPSHQIFTMNFFFSFFVHCNHENTIESGNFH